VEIKVYCKINENNEITSFVAGKSILEPEEYDALITVTDPETIEKLHDYKVVNTENGYELEKINAK
jgi:hypothetical protein